MHDIKSLLDGSLRRHHITPQVTTARMIEVVNSVLPTVLPAGRAADAVAVFVRDGSIWIHCRNASSAECVTTQEAHLIDAVKRIVPTARLDRVRTRIGI